MTKRHKLLTYTLGATFLHGAIALVTYGALVIAAKPSSPLAGIVEVGLVFCDVDEDYRGYALRIARGEVPYRDFLVEYPVLAVPFVILPHLVATDRNAFRVTFVLEMLLMDAAAVYLAARWVERREGFARILRRIAWYTFFFFALSPLVVGRYDLVPMMMAFAAASWWFSGRNLLGGLAAGVGALVKLFPGLVAGPALVWEISHLKQSRGRGIAAFAVTLIGGTVIWFGIGGAQVIDSLRYHAERGVEIESLYSGILMSLGEITGAGLAVVNDHDCLNLASPWSARIATWAITIQVAMILLALWRFWRTGMRDPIRYISAAVLAFVATGKVGSPQYMVWLIPFMAVLEGRIGDWARWGFLTCCLLTTAVCPWGFGGLRNLSPWAFGLLNLKNFLLLGLLMLLLFGPQETRSDDPVA